MQTRKTSTAETLVVINNKKLIDKKKSPSPLHFIEFQTQLIKLAELGSHYKLSKFALFLQMVNNKILFTTLDKQTYLMYLLYPYQNNMRKLSIIASFDEERCQLQFSYEKANFLTIHIDKKNTLSIKFEEGYQSTLLWNKQDITELAYYFVELFQPKQIIYTQQHLKYYAIPTYNKQEFGALIQQYQFASISYRINNVIINHAYKATSQYKFYLNWMDLGATLHKLKVTFKRSDHFYLPTDKNSPYSWFVTENKLLTHFPELKKYQLKPGQYYYSLSVDEIQPKDDKQIDSSILKIWLTVDASFGEVYEVTRGKHITGNEVLNIFHYFDHLFQIKHLFLCDASRFTHGEQTIPLRLISAIATGKTWYQSKLPGLKLFECERFETAVNGLITQNKQQRLSALHELQTLTLENWYAMLDNKQKLILIKLYKSYLGYQLRTGPCAFLDLDARNRLVRDNAKLTPPIRPPFKHNSTLRDLVSVIFINAKTKKSLADLADLSELLCGSDDLANVDKKVDENAQDYWVKSRVRELLWGSCFWERISKFENRNF